MQNFASSNLLTFGAIETDCLLVGRAEDALAVETRLDRVGRETLPRAVAHALASVLQALSGVIRIDIISVDFDLLRDGLDRGDLVRLWAARVAEVISAELERGYTKRVAFFDDYGDFTAAYLEHRFGEAAHPPWAFADFEPLRHLPAARAAVELLGSRPSYLAAVARRAVVRGRPDRLVERLAPAEIAEIFRRTDRPDGDPLSQEAVLQVAADHPALVRDGGWRTWTGPRRALSLALRILAQDRAAAPASTLRCARILADLSHAMESLPGPVDGPVMARLSDPDHEPRFGGPSHDARVALAPFLADGAGRAMLAELMTWLQDESPQCTTATDRDRGERDRPPSNVDPERESFRADEMPEVHTRGAKARIRRHSPEDREELLIDSPFAGIALCLTTVRRLAIHRLLPPLALREALIGLVEERLLALARSDRLIAALAPADPRDAVADWAEPPADSTKHLSDVERDEIAAASGAASWARLIAADFASVLPGLGGSSLGYLRRQFVQMPGVACFTPDTVEITLESVPLGVVLRMVGMTGWQGRLPWLGERGLVIEIGGP